MNDLEKWLQVEAGEAAEEKIAEDASTLKAGEEVATVMVAEIAESTLFKHTSG